MADTLITELPVAVALAGTEVVPVDQPNANPPGTYTTKRTTTQAIAQLAASASVIVNQQTGTSYQFVSTDRAKLVSFSNASPVTGNLPATGPGTTDSSIAWFVQVENRGAGDVTLVPDGASTIDGAASLVLVQNQGVLLAVGDDYNWYTQRGTGLTAATAVTSVGLALPTSVFNVTVSPITTTGTLTAVLQTQAANSIWAGPTSGAAATPTFRSMVTADLPDYGTAGTYGSATAIPVITTDVKGRVTATTTAIVPGSITSVAASSLLGNATGAPAAATSIGISTNFTFTGATLDLATNGVPFAKIQQVAASSLVGNPTGGLADVQGVTLGSTLAFSGTSLQTGAATGDVTWSANSYATTIANSAVTFAKFQDVAGLSVVGRAGNTTGVTAEITAASDGQVLRRSGTSLSFGAIDLTSANAVTGALTVSNGGTGATSQTAYAVLCGGTTSTAPTQSIASVGSAGQVLTSNGAGALPTFQAAGGATILNPQGRITLTSGTPVMNATVSAATTVYYTPYVGDLVPLYNGTVWTATAFAELSQATTDTTKSPAAVANNANYDLFVWNDGGTMRCTRGPLWSSDTARGTGAGTTELTRVNGVLMNAVSITNGPAAQRGTYVGSIRSNGSAQIDFVFGAAASGGTAAIVGIWNMYNRVPVRMTMTDSGTSYSYASNTLRAPRGGTGMRANFLLGLNDEPVAYQARASGSVTSGYFRVGIGLDSTSAATGSLSLAQNPTASNSNPEGTIRWDGFGGLGWHFLTNLESSDTVPSTVSFNGVSTLGVYCVGVFEASF